MLAVAISLFFGLVALFALATVAASVMRGLASGRAILAELKMLEAGYRPAPPVRTVAVRQRPRRVAAPVNPARAAIIARGWQPAAA